MQHFKPTVHSTLCHLRYVLGRGHLCIEYPPHIGIKSRVAVNNGQLRIHRTGEIIIITIIIRADFMNADREIRFDESDRSVRTQI